MVGPDAAAMHQHLKMNSFTRTSMLQVEQKRELEASEEGADFEKMGIGLLGLATCILGHGYNTSAKLMRTRHVWRTRRVNNSHCSFLISLRDLVNERNEIIEQSLCRLFSRSQKRSWLSMRGQAFLGNIVTGFKSL